MSNKQPMKLSAMLRLEQAGYQPVFAVAIVSCEEMF